MVSEDVSDSLVRNVVAEVGEGARDPIVSPTAVLFGHADDERLDLWADSRSARIGAMLGSIELAGDQATIPAEYRLRLGDTGDLGEKFATEASADFGKCAALGVGESDPAGQVRAQDSVLCDEVFALKE